MLVERDVVDEKATVWVLLIICFRMLIVSFGDKFEAGSSE